VFFITLFQGFLLGVLNVRHRSGSYERILLVYRSAPPPSGRLPRSFIGLMGFLHVASQFEMKSVALAFEC
jgi:hypothetical protein